MLNFKKFKSNENKKEFFKLIILLATMFTVIGILVGGWITNILWIVKQDDLVLSGEVIISIIGIPVFPIGMIHGIWLWF